jgi:hypothetical protein
VGANFSSYSVDKKQSRYSPGQALGVPEVEAPRFQGIRHMKVLRLSAIRTGRFYPPGNIPGTHLYQRLCRPQGHSAAGKIMSIKNSIETIGNRTDDHMSCGTVPQLTAPPRVAYSVDTEFIFRG